MEHEALPRLAVHHLDLLLISAVPSVAVTSACVSPRVNSADPWVRGSTPTSIVDRTDLVELRPSSRRPRSSASSFITLSLSCLRLSSRRLRRSTSSSGMPAIRLASTARRNCSSRASPRSASPRRADVGFVLDLTKSAADWPAPRPRSSSSRGRACQRVDAREHQGDRERELPRCRRRGRQHKLKNYGTVDQVITNLVGTIPEEGSRAAHRGQGDLQRAERKRRCATKRSTAAAVSTAAVWRGYPSD